MSEVPAGAGEEVLYRVVDGRIAIVTLNAPDKRNAVNAAVAQEWNISCAKSRRTMPSAWRYWHHGIVCALFGGGAEDLRAIRPPGPHKDIDLVFQAPGFEPIDTFLGDFAKDWPEIKAKRFPHKRAFLADGVMVEIFLAENGAAGLVTRFWAETEYRWPEPLIEPLPRPPATGFDVVSAGNPRRFRQTYSVIRSRAPR